jgi:glycosyltransferase involved in cell wall biosynthesis
MKIALIEPFFSGSHQQWATQLQGFSTHDIRIFSLKGRHWKWRMVGGALPLAQKLLEDSFSPDMILCSDMLDLATFMAFARKKLNGCPLAVYFHENQITYPWSPHDEDLQLERDHHYGYINFTSALLADALFFNSSFHKDSFLKALPLFLKKFPDQKQLHTVGSIRQKSQVLELGCHLKELDHFQTPEKAAHPTFLWNHRWEYDKNPSAFFQLLFRIKEAGLPFHLIVLGEQYRQSPAIFDEARIKLSDEIIHFGYAPSRKDYARLLWQADLLPVTSRQEFFGLSVVEAIYCNCQPFLPNRLSYPEHIPADLHHVHLYNKEEDLFRKVVRAMQEIDDIRLNNHYRNFVARYDWSNLASTYDARFQQLLQKGE